MKQQIVASLSLSLSEINKFFKLKKERASQIRSLGSIAGQGLSSAVTAAGPANL